MYHGFFIHSSPLVCFVPCFCWRLHIPGGSLVIPGFPFIVEGEARTSRSEPLSKCTRSTAVFSLFLTVESLSGLAGLFCWGTPKCRITLWSCSLSLKRSPSVFWWIGVGWRMVEICGWPSVSGSRTGAWARGLPVQQAETHGIPISGSRACSTLLHASLPSFSQGVHSFDLENGRWLLHGVSGESGDLPYCAAAFRSVPCPPLMSHPHHPRPWGSASVSSWGFAGASVCFSLSVIPLWRNSAESGKIPPSTFYLLNLVDIFWMHYYLLAHTPFPHEFLFISFLLEGKWDKYMCSSWLSLEDP